MGWQQLDYKESKCRLLRVSPISQMFLLRKRLTCLINVLRSDMKPKSQISIWTRVQIIVLFKIKSQSGRRCAVINGSLSGSFPDPITCDVFRIKREREEGEVKYSGFLHAINCFLSGKCKSTWHEQIDGVALAGCTFIWGLGKVLRVDVDGEGFNAHGMAVNTVNSLIDEKQN